VPVFLWRVSPYRNRVSGTNFASYAKELLRNPVSQPPRNPVDQPPPRNRVSGTKFSPSPKELFRNPVDQPPRNPVSQPPRNRVSGTKFSPSPKELFRNPVSQLSLDCLHQQAVLVPQQTNISHRQRPRLAIGRAIVNNPPVLILDVSTACSKVLPAPAPPASTKLQGKYYTTNRQHRQSPLVAFLKSLAPGGVRQADLYCANGLLPSAGNSARAGGPNLYAPAPVRARGDFRGEPGFGASQACSCAE
jgi:hypothetical protein